MREEKKIPKTLGNTKYRNKREKKKGEDHRFILNIPK